jgi:hypothetical protein
MFFVRSFGIAFYVISSRVFPVVQPFGSRRSPSRPYHALVCVSLVHLYLYPMAHFTLYSVDTEGVGKSSLISTFVSHHFSETVPGIMTRVRLPPDPDSNCITTIVDSQGGDAALISAVAAMSLTTETSSNYNSLSTFMDRASPSDSGAPPRSATVATGIEHVDSIILVYDLDRIETFYRLENHWLPLIERCYNGEVSSMAYVVFTRITRVCGCWSRAYP